MLKEHLERTLLIGIGLFSITRDKARAVTEELVKQGHVARTEIAEFTESLAQRGDEERAALRNVVHEEVDKTLSDMHLASARQIETLEAEIASLKAQLADLTKTKPAEESAD
ncbi:MAG: hypothetical protein JXB35_08725 [Anaerolineae bacterium]|nr:hypothetical protein [Anaerolineae bacterium]